jgi:hypothetical protein
MIEPHRVHEVDVSVIEVDAGLWDAVRLAVPLRDPCLTPALPVFPVFARDTRLVLLAGFNTFFAAVDAGVRHVSVWPVEITAGDRAEEYAIALSLADEVPR